MLYHCVNSYYLNFTRKVDDIVFQAAAVDVEGGMYWVWIGTHAEYDAIDANKI